MAPRRFWLLFLLLLFALSATRTLAQTAAPQATPAGQWRPPAASPAPTAPGVNPGVAQPTTADQWRPPAALSGGAQVQVGSYGYVDWANMRLVAVGVGAPPQRREGQSESVVKAMAARASLLDARRNLLEVVKEVSIDSETRVVDFMTKSDVVVNRLSGVLQVARVERVRPLPDGAVETTVSMPLTGVLGEELARLPARQQPVEPLQTPPQTTAQAAPEPAPAGAKRPEQLPTPIKERTNTASQGPQAPASPTVQATSPPVIPAATPPRVPGGGYSGLVVDARGLNFKPALKPELYGPDGALLYPGRNVDVAATAKRGFVRYYRNLDQAQRSDLVGGLPQTIKPEGLAPGKASGLQLDGATAEQLKLLLQTPGNYLDGGNVVVVF